MTRLLAILLIATACHGQTNAPLIGCDSASGRDSSELPKIYGVIQPQIVRSQGVWWSTCEPKPGVYVWTAFDAMLAQNTVTNFANVASNMAPLTNAAQPLLMFNVYNPPAFYTNSQASYMVGEYNFIQALLRHAPHAIQIIEFINEPSGGEGWVPQCTNDEQIASYTASLAVVLKSAITAIDPTVLLAGPSLSGPWDTNFFKTFAANGGFWACDIVTFHDYRMSGVSSNDPTYSPYVPMNWRPNLAGCVQACDFYSGGKPICVSELGLGTPENTIAYGIESRKLGIWALCPTYWLGANPALWQVNYWTTNNVPKPNGSAFLATLRAEQTP